MVAALLLALAAAPRAAPAASPAAAPEPPPGERVVEEVVATVRNPASAPPRVVTLTKLQEEARIALASRGATAASTGPLDRELLRATLEWLLDEMLLDDEAGRLRIAEVGRDETISELGRFRARFASPEEYQRFLAASEIGEEELLVSLGRSLRVRRYLESRVGRAARVGEDEVDRWLAERHAETGPGPAREAARAQLVEERARAQVKDLIGEVRSRADVRIVGLRGGGEG